MGNKRSNNRSKHEKIEPKIDGAKQYKLKTGNKTKSSKKRHKRHPILKKIIKAIIILTIILIIICAGIFAGIFFGLFGDDFKITKDDLLISKNNSVVKDADGNIIANLAGDENRKIISMDEMPEYLPKAFVAIEDERFYTHQGVDIKRTAAATLTYIFNKGSSSFGGSTITQQLVKNLTNEKQDSPIRKVKEMSKAYQVERLISKDQVLELYLNLIFLGDKAYGVEVASQYYFSKPAKDLTIAESAYLAGINHIPNGYKPFEEYSGKENSEELKNKMSDKINKRTKTVLSKMKELGYIDEEKYNTAVAEVDTGLAFKKGNVTTGSASYSYHTAATINQVKKDLMEKNGWTEEFADFNLRNNGYVIYSTQDSSIQASMEETFKNDKYVRKGKNENGEVEYSQAGMAVIENGTGKVVGVMGGLGSSTNAVGLNRATQAYRQTGSSMKPLAVVAPGLEMNILTAGTVYDDSYTVFPGGYDPKNYNSFKGPITIRDALETSQNIPQLKGISEIGPAKSLEFLRKMGFNKLVSASENAKTNDENLASLALGGLTIGASPLEMAAAYSTIANNGEYVTPIFYTKVEDKDGNLVIEPTQERSRVISEQNAYILQNLLKEPVVGGAGTATYCKISGIDVAAKTGTTNGDKDRWLCGFTPYYSAATWYGYDTPQTVYYKGSPSNPAGALWSAVMKNIHKDKENKKFVEPSGIVRATICKDTGLLAGETCANKYSEIFVKGTAPKETCTGSVTIKVCTETGMIANEFCKTTEEKVYNMKPPKEQNPNWKSDYGDRYNDPPTENCTTHTKPADTTKPEIKLKGKETITLKLNEKYVDPGATATDDTDGDITSKIVIDISEVDVKKVGTYKVTYTVSDSAGNTATKTRTIKVVDKKDETEEPETPGEGDGSETEEPETPGEENLVTEE